MAKTKAEVRKRCEVLLDRFTKQTQDYIETGEYLKGLKNWLLEINNTIRSAEMSNMFQGWTYTHDDICDIAEHTLLIWLNTLKPSEMPHKLAAFVRFVLLLQFPAPEEGSRDMKLLYACYDSLRNETPLWWSEKTPYVPKKPTKLKNPPFGYYLGQPKE